MRIEATRMRRAVGSGSDGSDGCDGDAVLTVGHDGDERDVGIDVFVEPGVGETDAVSVPGACEFAGIVGERSSGVGWLFGVAGLFISVRFL
jgi:hypothetical protein